MAADEPTMDSLGKKYEVFEVELVGLMWAEVRNPCLSTSRKVTWER